MTGPFIWNPEPLSILPCSSLIALTNHFELLLLLSLSLSHRHSLALTFYLSHNLSLSFSQSISLSLSLSLFCSMHALSHAQSHAHALSVLKICSIILWMLLLLAAIHHSAVLQLQKRKTGLTLSHVSLKP